MSNLQQTLVQYLQCIAKMLTVYSHYLSSDKWSNLGQPGADNKKIQNFFLQ